MKFISGSVLKNLQFWIQNGEHSHEEFYIFSGSAMLGLLERRITEVASEGDLDLLISTTNEIVPPSIDLLKQAVHMVSYP